MVDSGKRGKMTARNLEINNLAVTKVNPSESLLCELSSTEKMCSATKNDENKDGENQQFGHG